MKMACLILSIYLLGLTALPCADIEAYAANNINSIEHLDQYQSNSHDHNHSDNEDDCSPLCVCSCCHLHISIPTGISLTHPEGVLPVYNQYPVHLEGIEIFDFLKPPMC